MLPWLHVSVLNIALKELVHGFWICVREYLVFKLEAISIVLHLQECAFRMLV